MIEIATDSAEQSPPVAAAESIGPDEPPVIPASRMEAGWLRDMHLLLWVHTGSAQVDLDDGSSYRVSAGEGVWVPAGLPGRASLDAGSVAFPYAITPKSAPRAPSGPAHFDVPSSWHDWLILHAVQWPNDGYGKFGYSPSSLVDLLAGKSTPPSAREKPVQRESLIPGKEPDLPTAPGAYLVAQRLRTNPALDHSIEEWSRLVACSVSTLRRGFAATGLTFAQWRTLIRLAVGCEFLAAGDDVEQTAIQVGFSSRNGFTRAFREHYGITPSDYAAHTIDPSRAPSPRVAAERATSAIGRLLTQTATLPSEPPPLPATHTDWHTNEVHVLAWTYRGESYLHIGESNYPRHTGDAIWIPAGIEHQAGNLEDSIALPICWLPPGHTRITEPLRAHFPPNWNTYLLHRAVATRTPLRPESFDPLDILDLFLEQFASQRARTIPMPEDARAHAVATHFLQQMRTARDTVLDADIHEAFRRETGMTFLRWQHAARMQVARDLLEHGARPDNVSRRVGYTHLRSFSRAFTSFYGTPPSQYRKSVAARTER
ncbi:MAG: helix-turn-helix domain-containing protein [Ancrocorticia sp.]